MKIIQQIIVTLALVIGCSTAWSETRTVTSGTNKNAILELYTSEGCSSCPPAEIWLSLAGRSDEYPQEDFIPLAFFVDYWDYLGWKDPFAHPDYSMRQKMHQINGGIRTLYTPQLILNANELRPTKVLPQRFKKITNSKAPLQLDLAVTKSDDSWEVELQSTPLEPLLAAEQSLYLAITENNIISSISAGENHGKTLTHDFVVRKMIGPLPIELSAESTINQTISLEPDWRADQLNVVAFVQTMRGEILQAVTLPAN